MKCFEGTKKVEFFQKYALVAILIVLTATWGINYHINRAKILLLERPSPPVSAGAGAAPPEAPAAPKSAWYVQEPSTNPIDGTKDQILVLDANENNLHRRRGVDLVLSFRNGKLTHSPLVGARIDVGGFVAGSQEHIVRLRFDDEKPIRESWSSTDSHDALYPNSENNFLVQLMHHKKLAVEFSLYEEAPQTVTFTLENLTDEMKKAGLHDSTAAIAAAVAAERTRTLAAEAQDQANANAALTAGEERLEAEDKIAKAANAALRERIIPNVAPCSYDAKSWCWSDPNDVRFAQPTYGGRTREEAIQDAMQAALAARVSGWPVPFKPK